MISVVIPVYNAAPYVRASIESALSQTYRPMEILCINDASTDGSREILESFGDSIALFHHHEAKGASAARNLGISKASGDWVAFLDADDLWDPQKLELQMSAATDQDSILHADSRAIDAEGNVTDESINKRLVVPSPTLSDVVIANQVLMLTAVVRRKALNSVRGLDESNRWAALDWQLWLRLAATGHRFRYLNRALASYRIHGNNMTANREKHLRGHLYALRRTREEYPEAFGTAERRAYWRRMSDLHYQLALQVHARGGHREASAEFLRAARCRPLRVRAWVRAAAAYLSLPRVKTG